MEHAVYEQIRHLILRTSGIALGDHRQALVESRLLKRMRALGVPRFEDYCSYVLAHPAGEELEAMINAITTNLTGFFREPQHFEWLGQHLRTAAAQSQAEFSLWSAGCSTGEEAYSAAVVCRENLPESTELRILATDISTEVLEAARFGAYSRDKVDSLPPAIPRKYFQRGLHDAAEFVRVKPELRRLVAFQRVNLTHPLHPREAPFDVIFCRNVMIYFDPVTRRRLVQAFKGLLKPCGHLVLGASESILGIDADFQPVQASIYQLARLGTDTPSCAPPAFLEDAKRSG
jgi:chemotaxis protein methyltransferase CheR